MKTAVLALAVFWHSVFAGSARVQPVVGSMNGEAKARRGLEETKLKCCHRSSSWMWRGFGVRFFWSGYVELCVSQVIELEMYSVAFMQVVLCIASRGRLEFPRQHLISRNQSGRRRCTFVY